ncbi:transposase, MuDR, MULE transposase domain protein [Tanacetum coccineum]|uniref:Transposase, MuDR, MULE transposase domain protein n=1 Tax=Tanacetum coccineum TaxID=301880 RepID=A0ABQ5ERD3_9ASTR
MKKNQGTVTRIKTDDNGVFKMLFIAIGASICTFLNYLRPVLMIDVAHLKGLYKGTNLVAVAMNGNNQIVPISFGICKGETDPCWSWWMSVLKECIGDNLNLLFISDRHVAIALAVEKEFPLAFHAVWKQIRNDYHTNVMYDIAKVAGKLQIFVAHTPIDLSTVLIPNDGSFKKSLAGVISEETKIKLEESLKYLHQMQKRNNKKFDYYGLWGELVKPENVRLTVFIETYKEAIDGEAILEDQILDLMHRFADRV